MLARSVAAWSVRPRCSPLSCLANTLSVQSAQLQIQRNAQRFGGRGFGILTQPNLTRERQLGGVWASRAIARRWTAVNAIKLQGIRVPLCGDYCTNAGKNNRDERERTREQQREQNKMVLKWMLAVITALLGLSYASVPMYRMFCQVTGYGGKAERKSVKEVSSMEPVLSRPLVIHFNADVSDRMPWKFRPIQKEVTCVPGEPVLAFFNATNTSDEPLIGISTYNVTPPKAGVYFNKIQCFCFEEQQLQPHESVDMPVFFFIDPEFCADDNLHGVDELTLSYTFFKVDQADSVR